MATKLTKRGKLDNEITYEFVCDTPADLQVISLQPEATYDVSQLTYEAGE